MSWWKSIFPKRASDAQMNTELRFHIDELIDENIAAGMSAEEARRRAMLDFGGQEKFKEEVRDVYRIRVLDATLANLKSAFRFIRKSPTFSATVILTLALAIGANSAVFSAIDAILLKPLPFPQSDQLMRLQQRHPKLSIPNPFVAPIRLEDWNRLNSTFQAITGYYTEDISETSAALPEEFTEALVAPRFLQVWGVAPALGRDFSFEEGRAGGPDAVIISDRFWRRRFAANPNALGQKLHIGNSSYTVVGIMPASFLFPDRDVDLWSPVPVDVPYAQSRESTWYTAIGRLKPGISIDQARANLGTVQDQLAQQFPKTDAELSVGIDPLKETAIASSRRSLWLLFGSVSLLLLIACTNIIALLLARATQRQHEISVRFSMGAPRGALIAQLLTETFLLALLGALLGLLAANAASGVFRSLAASLPRVEEIRLDARIVLYSLACSVIVTLLCGLFPAIRGTRRNLYGSLNQASRTQVSGRNSLQWLLVGIQVALAVTLLSGAGLLLRTFQELGRVSPGYDPSHILTFQISVGWGETADLKKLRQKTDRILEALRSTPGVEAAAISVGVPGVPFKYQTELKLVEGRAESEPKLFADNHLVSASYFATMKIPMLEGALCRETDGPPSVVVNRSFANAYFTDSQVIGHHLEASNLGYSGSAEIVGISGDAREAGLDQPPVPTVYWCAPVAEPGTYFLVRTHNAPMTMAETIREQIHDFEPQRSVYNFAPLEQHFSDALAEGRLRTILLTFFAATALSLACIGLYGTLSYNVNVRRREVGLRLALGALRGQIIRQFLWQGLVVCIVGCVAGWVLAAASGRLLTGLLYGVSPTDIPTLTAVILLVLVVAAVASLIPATRAARVEPMQVLRNE
ncbi:MAG TPA: ABC transporter permease [Candidatus Acidoferrum sp.]|nr:ABC transporter permease [Candidatus Acidoferrum sp.]